MAPDSAGGTNLSGSMLEEACRGLARRAPAMSARRVFTFTQIAVFVLLGWGLWRAFAQAPALSLQVAHFAALLLFGSAVVLRLFAAGASLMVATPQDEGWRGELPVYTLLCPLKGEANVADRLVQALARLDYPADRRDAILIVEADDDATVAAVRALDLPQGFSIVVVPAAAPRTKPKALNYALAHARGDFVAVYDAEDAPHPRQLRAALDAFARGGERLGAVQAPLLIDNARASWISGQFATEYAVQFRGLLPLLAHMDAALPLGGAGNHFRRAALDDVGAWDPFNVTEDADLAYRLARHGWRLGVIDTPTWEEAPARFGPWFRQRTRWLKGHMQTWLVLMRDPLRTLRDLGVKDFLLMQLVLGGGVLAAMAHLPLLAWLATAAVAPDIARITPLDWTLVICGYAVATLAAVFVAARERSPRLALNAVTMPLYWPLASLAALMAVLELLVRPHHWAKTDHGQTARETPEPRRGSP